MMKYLPVLICVSLLQSLNAHAKDITVCATCEAESVAEAVRLAADGDCILILPGIYYEREIVIDKAVSVEGAGYPILDGSNKNAVLRITADDVTIKGLHIRNVGQSYTEDRAGIRVDHAHRVRIQNNILENAFFAIYLAYTRHSDVVNNVILGNAQNEVSSGNGIHLWYCKHITIHDNKIKGHRDGIYFEFADSSDIRNNLSEENLRYGLHFMFSNDDAYAYNVFRANGSGVAVMFSRRIAMHHNLFEHNWGTASYGLLLKEIYDTEISENHFHRNTIGINLEGATRIQYHHNRFEGNGWALRIAGGCLDNVFSENDFHGNSFDISMERSQSSNIFHANYWSEYNGYDLDRDGTGDVPYRPVKLFSFVVNQTPEALVLLRSWFIDILNFAEKVTPVLTPTNVIDENPRMQPVTIPQLPVDRIQAGSLYAAPNSLLKKETNK
jgi:nitrous oxidase accessory protein